MKTKFKKTRLILALVDCTILPFLEPSDSHVAKDSSSVDKYEGTAGEFFIIKKKLVYLNIHTYIQMFKVYQRQTATLSRSLFHSRHFKLLNIKVLKFGRSQMFDLNNMRTKLKKKTRKFDKLGRKKTC